MKSPDIFPAFNLKSKARRALNFPSINPCAFRPKKFLKAPSTGKITGGELTEFQLPKDFLSTEWKPKRLAIRNFMTDSFGACSAPLFFRHWFCIFFHCPI